jgi:hypothetical protein
VLTQVIPARRYHFIHSMYLHMLELEILTAGFSVVELKAAGFVTDSLRAAGFAGLNFSIISVHHHIIYILQTHYMLMIFQIRAWGSSKNT